MPDDTELLGRTALFAGVSKRDLQHLAKAAHHMTFEPGAHLTNEDEVGVTFFVVMKGEADVSVGGQSRRRLRAGDYFGEMSIIDRSPRSAEVVAVTELECLVFTQWEFRPFLKDHPDVAWAVLESLVKRLREVEKTFLSQS
ncbi:MAG: cyclic nucleotide-binding domain-containing protein [Acidimicrobiales bacterium]|jgi:CRP-like cAMP-binding protein